MLAGYITRALEPVLKRAASEFPAVVLTGPRQSGKTTLLKRLFSRECHYVSLEPPDVRAAASSDPRGLVEMYPPPTIFDEVQYAPDLLPYIKERIDLERDRPGQYFITGSQNLLLMQTITESLAGRAAMLQLLPLSRSEAAGRPRAKLPWETTPRTSKHKMIPLRDLWIDFLRGGFPELAVNRNRDRDIGLWHASYVRTYLERDLRNLRQVGDLTQFQNFLRALAGRSAQLLHISDLARDLGVAVNTIKAWLSVLEASYQVYILRPYFANVGKRLVKTPKVYFMDVGTLCYLAGLKDPEHAASGPMGGAILETAVLSEIVRSLVHRGLSPDVYFWRTAAGSEVDFVLETGKRLVPIEVKLSATPRATMAAGIRELRRDLGDRVDKGVVVHLGDVRLPLGPDATAVSFGEF